MGLLGLAFTAFKGSAASPVVLPNGRPTLILSPSGDGVTGVPRDTHAIQNAIDTLAQSGGGTVRLLPGTFSSGSLFLKSHVTLHLDAGAVLFGSPHQKDYSKLDFLALLQADGQEDIGITGPGMIDGQGALLVQDTRKLLPQRNPPFANEANRPFIVNFRDCKQVVIRDITFTNGACWMQDYHNCTNLLVENVKVRTLSAITNDGLDVDGCAEVVVRGCDIDSEDDGICLKSSNHACENVLVENCRVRSSCYAFKLGTASAKGFRNITCRNLDIYDTYRSGLAIECVDGGELENVNISDIRMTNTCNALFIRLGHRNAGGPAGSLHHVTISNVKAYIPNRDRKEMNKFPPDWPPHGNTPLIPASITGIPGYPVRDITLRQVSIIFGSPVADSKPKAKRLEAKSKLALAESFARVPENEKNYPSCAMLGAIPAWGLYCRHAEGLVLDQVTLEDRGQDSRPAMGCDEVENITLNGLRISAAASDPLIYFNEVQGARITNSTPPESPRQFLQAQTHCRDIKNQ